MTLSGVVVRAQVSRENCNEGRTPFTAGRQPSLARPLRPKYRYRTRPRGAQLRTPAEHQRRQSHRPWPARSRLCRKLLRVINRQCADGQVAVAESTDPTVPLARTVDTPGTYGTHVDGLWESLWRVLAKPVDRRLTAISARSRLQTWSMSRRGTPPGRGWRPKKAHERYQKI